MSSQRSRSAETWRPPLVFVIACALAAALVVRYMLMSGTWLDEYWQLWISAAPAGDMPARLAADAHPPWFNLLARIILSATASSIPSARLANFGLASIALAAGLMRIKQLAPGTRWGMWLLVVASGGIAGMTELAASLRVYPWLLALAALQAAMLLAVAKRGSVPAVLAAVVTATSVGLHYVHAIGAIAIALVTLAVAGRQSPAFRAIAVGLIAGVALDLVCGLVQLPHWRANFDVNWIGANGGGAVQGFAQLATSLLLLNPVSAVLVAAGLARRRRSTLLLIAPLTIALVGWVVLDAAAPVIVPRYLASATALLATAAAASWAELDVGPALSSAIAVLAALQPLMSSMQRPPLPGWEVGARLAASVQRSCPGTVVYAVSSWRFRDHPDSRTAAFEKPVEQLAYARVGARFAVHPKFVSGPTGIAPGGCPVVLWMEAAHGVDRLAPAVVLRRAQIELGAAAKARSIPTPNGALLLISRADRLQRGR